MSFFRLAAIAITALLHILCLPANATEPCPRTIGFDQAFSEPWPVASTWFGTEALAVILPRDGIWPATVPGHLIAVKVFWYSKEFEARSDTWSETGFTARVRRLGDGPDDAVISDANWAGGGSMGKNWAMLTGIDFPSEGCWEISGEYLGQSLTFVVKTVDSTDYLKRQSAAKR